MVIDERRTPTAAVEDVPEPAAPGVVVDVECSALNYKDWLVAQPRSRVRRAPRLVGGVEAVGRVRADTEEFRAATRVSVCGGLIGVGLDGGFTASVVADARYVSAVPPTLSAQDAAALGLAGYTAMASALALEDHGHVPGDGPTLVTGASGGVGSVAVAILAQRGHHVVASTGSSEHARWLTQLGASEVVGRDEVTDRADRVLGSERWSAAVDCVGGATLPAVLRSLRYGGVVAASGLVAGSDLATTVYPFITRAVTLVGIDAVEAPAAERARVWEELGTVSVPHSLIEEIIGLDAVPEALESFATGATRGRVLVDVTR